MPVRVLEIEAPPAIVAVDLIAAMACRIGPIGQAARLDPGKDAVELGFADQKGVVLGGEISGFSVSAKSREMPFSSGTTRKWKKAAGSGSPRISVRNRAERALSRHQMMV